MTERQHEGDCNISVDTRTDPPVKNSLFVSILLAIVGVLCIAFATVVYGQIQGQASTLKEQTAKNDAQEIRIAQMETSFYYIKQSLDKIEQNTKTTADKVERLEQRMKNK